MKDRRTDRPDDGQEVRQDKAIPVHKLCYWGTR